VLTYLFCYATVYSIDMVHIGGTRTDHDTDLKPRPADAEKILQQAYRTMPALKVSSLCSDYISAC